MSGKSALKRISMYFVVLIGLLFVGFIAYYFSRVDETIALNIEEGSSIYLNKKETVYLPIDHEDGDGTSVPTITFSNEGVVTYSSATKSFEAVKGGVTSVTVTYENTKFGPFRFDILVGDGSEENPYFIKAAADLKKIGVEPIEEGVIKWETSDSYELLLNIDLTNIYTEEEPTWTPIEVFSGNFNGGGFSISNLLVEGSYLNAGLFGTLTTSANVENLIIKNAIFNITDADRIGILAGTNYGFIGKVSVQGEITYLKGSATTTVGVDMDDPENPGNTITVQTTVPAIVGGIVGLNQYNGIRPVLNMVSSNIVYTGGAIFGGVIGENNGGVLFNSYAEIKKLSQTDVVNFKDDAIIGGLIGTNSPVKTGTGEDEIFRQSIVKNNYVIFTLIEPSTLASVYAFVGKNTETANIYDYINTYISNYATGATLLIFGKTPTNEEMAIKEIEFMKLEDTYADWSFGTVWNIEDKYPFLNTESSYESVGIADPGQTLTNSNDVETMLTKFIANPSSGLSYTISSATSIVIDLEGTDWEPLNGFNGSIIVEEGTSFTIKNINIVVDEEDLDPIYSNNIGFFGMINSQSTVLKNIKFENITITLPESAVSMINVYVGGIVGNLVKGLIEGCSVNGIKIINGSKVGFVVGFLAENATLKDISVGDNYTEEQVNDIEYIGTSSSAYFGGITGYAYGKMDNVSVDNATMTIDASFVFLHIGGITGSLNSGTISHGYNKGLIVNTSATQGYFGGIAGIFNSGTIEYCYNIGSITTMIAANNYSNIGGITTYVGSEAKIIRSFAEPISMRGRTVGGIATQNHGVIKECYVRGDFEGWTLGGLTVYNYGILTHSYSFANLKSISQLDTDKVAGIAVYVKENSLVSYIFSSTYMQTSKAKKYAETWSTFRYTNFDYDVANILSGFTKERAGTLENCIVINYSDAEVQTTAWGNKPGFFEASIEDCKGLTSNRVFENAGFTAASPQIWLFEDGEFPILKYVVANPLAE